MAKRKARPRVQTSLDTKGPQALVSGTATAPGLGTVPSSGGGTPPLTSLDIFARCIERAENLIKIHEAAHGRQARPEPFLSDAHRAAIVLAISALDAYVRSFVVSNARNIIANKAKTLPAALASQIKNYLREDALLEAARKDDLLDRVEKALRDDFEKKSFQGTKSITDALKLLGHEDIFHEVAVSAGVNEDNLRERLDHYTQRRHDVAHQGDYDISQNPPQENPITKKDAEDCIKIVEMVAINIDKVGVK
jgi:HEPN superfamily RiboL-PSP-like protein